MTGVQSCALPIFAEIRGKLKNDYLDTEDMRRMMYRLDAIQGELAMRKRTETGVQNSEESDKQLAMEGKTEAAQEDVVLRSGELVDKLRSYSNKTPEAKSVDEGITRIDKDIIDLYKDQIGLQQRLQNLMIKRQGAGKKSKRLSDAVGEMTDAILGLRENAPDKAVPHQGKALEHMKEEQKSMQFADPENKND